MKWKIKDLTEKNKAIEHDEDVSSVVIRVQKKNRESVYTIPVQKEDTIEISYTKNE